jgi:hypothetical protein
LLASQIALKTRETKLAVANETYEILKEALDKRQSNDENNRTLHVHQYIGMHREGLREFGYCTPEKELLKANFERQMEKLQSDHYKECLKEDNLTKYIDNLLKVK